MDRGEVLRELFHLRVAHQQGARRYLVRGPQDLVVVATLVQEDLLWLRVRVGVRHQVLAELRVEVVVAVQTVDRVEACSDAVGQFVGVVGVHQHTHRGGQMVDSMILTLDKSAEVPEAGEDLLHGFVDTLVLGLTLLLGVGVVQPCAAETRQILVVGAGAVAQRAPLRGYLGVHGGQRVDHPLRTFGFLDHFPEVIQHLILDLEVRLESGMNQDRLDGVNQLRAGGQRESVLFGALAFTEHLLRGQGGVVHELVVEVERDGEPLGHRARGKAQRPQHGHIGRLDPERAPVVEVDIAERGDLRDREVAFGDLRAGGPGRGVVRIHLCQRRRPQFVAVRCHLVAHVAVDQRVDRILPERVLDVRVGHAVLHRAQVDMGERRLRHRGDDPADPRQLVGQRLVDSRC